MALVAHLQAPPPSAWAPTGGCHRHAGQTALAAVSRTAWLGDTWSSPASHHPAVTSAQSSKPAGPAMPRHPGHPGSVGRVVVHERTWLRRRGAVQDPVAAGAGEPVPLPVAAQPQLEPAAGQAVAPGAHRALAGEPLERGPSLGDVG